VSPVSLLLDSSSEICGGKYLFVFVRYINLDKETPMLKLLSIIELGSVQAGDHLYNLINQEIFRMNSEIRKKPN